MRLPRDKDALKRDFPDLNVGGALKVTALIEKALSTIDNNKKRGIILCVVPDILYLLISCDQVSLEVHCFNQYNERIITIIYAFILFHH